MQCGEGRGPAGCRAGNWDLQQDSQTSHRTIHPTSYSHCRGLRETLLMAPSPREPLPQSSSTDSLPGTTSGKRWAQSASPLREQPPQAGGLLWALLADSHGRAYSQRPVAHSPCPGVFTAAATWASGFFLPDSASLDSAMNTRDTLSVK